MKIIKMTLTGDCGYIELESDAVVDGAIIDIRLFTLDGKLKDERQTWSEASRINNFTAAADCIWTHLYGKSGSNLNIAAIRELLKRMP